MSSVRPVTPVPARPLGSYEIVQRLATGGMAEVYVARRMGAYGFSKNVALKRILPQLAKDPDFVAMFIDEARTCARLSHPNLVEVFDFGDDNGELFMAMELVDGTTCAKLIRAAATRGETIPIENSLHIVLSVLRGLAYAHNAMDENGVPFGLVHRDVSPGNLLLARTGIVKLGDFGIVRASDLERRTDQGQLKGKLGYMSPEQVLGRELDARSDLFTVGIVLAELLTGFPLFATGAELDILFRIRDAETSNFSRHCDHVPEELRAVVYRALAQNADDRFQCAEVFAEAIEDVARRRRLTIGPTRLAAFLEFLGLVKATGRSGEYRMDNPGPVIPRAPASAPKPLAKATSLGIASVATDDVPPPRPTTYRVRLPDGNVSSAAPLARILELFVAGRAHADALVSRDDGPFLPAREHQELHRVVSSTAHRWAQAPHALASGVWPIEAATVPLRLFDLAARRTTGVLYAQTGKRRKKIYLVDGSIEYTVSTDREEMLGEQLVRKGLVLPLELDMALSVAPRYGGRIGDALINVGVLRPLELFRALVEQVHLRIADLVSWRSGELLFEPGIRSNEEALPPSPPPFEIICQGVLSCYKEREFRQILQPHFDAVVSLDDRGRGVPPVALRLPAPETYVIGAIDGMRTLRMLLHDLPRQGVADEFQVLRGVFLGLTARSVLIDGWPGPSERGWLASIPTVVEQSESLFING